MKQEYLIAEYLRRQVINSHRYLRDGHKYYVAAATLDRRGRIIAIGFNSPIKSHPLMFYYSKKTTRNKYKIYLHAEISALVKSQREVDTLIVVRVNKHKEVALAKPCPICQMAIKDAQVRRVYFTNDIGELVLLS